MKLRITSDTHNELVPPADYKAHMDYFLPRTRQDKDSVLILAGDTWSYARRESYEFYLNAVKDRFRAIIHVAGNHEWYKSSFIGGDTDFLEFTATIPNFHQLTGNAVVIDDTVFIGATLWTDFNKDDGSAMLVASSYMNDYRLISYKDASNNEYRYLEPIDTYKAHKRELAGIIAELENPAYANLKKVVVTHHGCSYKSIHMMYQNAGYSNFAFTSDLDAIVLKYQPKYWIHGHTHCSFNYFINNTNVIVNPCGYKHGFRARYENVEYNPKLIVSV